MKTLLGKPVLFVGAICLLTTVVLVLTYNQVLLYTTFYGYEPKSSGSLSFKLVLASCLALLAWAALYPRLRGWQFLIIAIVVGTVAQFAFAYTEGRGFEGIRGRALAGHGRFVVDALAANNAAATLRNYETLASSGKLGQYPQSKPPGTLLFYVLTERVSRLVVPHTYDERKRLDRFVDFLAVVWPFVATLAILPLYWLATMLGGRTEARLAATLYVLVPSFNLVTLHTDQVLFPFLFVSVLALFVWALHAHRPPVLAGRGLAVGAALCLAVFCDFPLAVAGLLCVGLWLAAFLRDQRSFQDRIRTTAILAGSALAGLVAPAIVLWLAFGYNPIVRWRAALAFHAAWRKVPAIVSLDAGMSNIAEFFDWTGVPISLLALGIFVMARASRTADEEPRSLPHVALMAALMCLVGYLAFFSRTVAETARLWLFLMPVMCLVAARTLSVVQRTIRWAPFLVFGLQFATVYLIKISHDFW